MNVKSKPTRRHSVQFKAEVVAACSEPSASVTNAIGLGIDKSDTRFVLHYQIPVRRVPEAERAG